MKLIELVTKSLEIIGGGWPENVVAMSQGSDGMIRAYVRRGDDICIRPDYMTKVTCLAIDFETALVTREQYEAALAASQRVEWDGAGMPPVGCEFEYGTHRTKAKCLAIGHHMVFASKGNLDDEDGDYEEFMIDAQIEFHPIRSEADKKRDDAVSAMVKFDLDRRTVGIDALYPALYNAIAAGKIPGVKLED